ncbi:hypothetical protein DPMN_116020 [Dreissena polymorpha]|uniref:Uncharacterized protein n=1 Tax=Dreissena polymorpha TaxID=45954 RepID=A0A9D4KN59_DREPO|nr:hypothetical protein DPMN_116020 [Dreissena polymorpha]
MCQKCLRRNPTTDEHGATFVVQTSLLSEESSVNQSARDASVEIESNAMDYSRVESVGDTSESDAMDYSSVRDADSTDTASADQLNQPFDLLDRPAINQDPETVETDIGDESLSTTVVEEQAVTFEVIEIGSKKGKPLLVVSDGFRYSVKKTQKNSVL